jgi:hypothetical protein
MRELPAAGLIVLADKGYHGAVRLANAAIDDVHRVLLAAAPAVDLLRYACGKLITTRCCDCLWSRIGTYLPWVATQHISTHWLWHTTLTSSRAARRRP